MAFDINEFRAKIAKTGFTKPSSYMVQITAPSSINSAIVEELPFRVDSVNVPGAMMAMDNFKPKGYGLTEHRVIDYSHEDITMTIIGDRQGKVEEFLTKWFKSIFPLNSKNNNERFRYPVEYYGTLDLYRYDSSGEQAIKYSYSEAYPINIGAIQLGWANVDTFVQIPVTFTYRIQTINDDESNSSSVASRTSGLERNIELIKKQPRLISESEYARRLEAL